MEIGGLPLHPLVIHAVVVLVPLAAIGGIVISFWPRARKQYGWLTVAFAAAATGSTFVAQEAGEDLARNFAQPSQILLTHEALGKTLLVWVTLVFVGTCILMLAQRMIDRDQTGGKTAQFVGAVVAVVGGVASTVQVVRIGHSGATAVWGG